MKSVKSIGTRGILIESSNKMLIWTIKNQQKSEIGKLIKLQRIKLYGYVNKKREKMRVKLNKVKTRRGGSKRR